MSIDIHTLNLLAHAQHLGVSYARTLGIGRQVVNVEAHELEPHRVARNIGSLSEAALQASPRYFEPLMREWFGASVVDSVDASADAQATYVHDMNLPFAERSAMRNGYDAVLDFGGLAQVFDIANAWRNCVDACRLGGHILHVLPVNNLSGHGFYQFSPELFFNLYRAERGFDVRGLYVAMTNEPRYWWSVADPREVKRRVVLHNGHAVVMLVVAKKVRDAHRLPAPQRSDYSELARSADEEAMPVPPRVTDDDSLPFAHVRPRMIEKLAALGLLNTVRAIGSRWQAIATSGLSLPAPDYRRLNVAQLLRGSKKR